jgi:hypothetical protein
MVAAIKDRSFILDVECYYCGNIYSVILNKEDLLDWASGSGPIEKILHYLSANERELLISNTCGKCFDKLFPPLDNDE